MMRAAWVMLALSSPLAAQDAPAAFDAARTLPLSAGQWSYAGTLGGSEARFGSAFAIRCDRVARLVTLRRIGPVVTTPASAMTITTDLGVRTLASNGVVANRDTVLDAIAFSRGRFIVDGGGLRLVLPASPEAARSIEDCRI
jgi:hypothetical protein